MLVTKCIDIIEFRCPTPRRWSPSKAEFLNKDSFLKLINPTVIHRVD